MTTRVSTGETVLVLDKELEQRIGAAARLAGMHPTEFIVKAIQHCCAQALGETTKRSVCRTATQGGRFMDVLHHDQVAAGLRTTGPWAIRPTQSRVLREVAEASRLSVETVIGPGRGRAAARARAVAAFLLCNDAGLSQKETARILNRGPAMVARYTRSVDRVIGTAAPHATLLESARRRLKNGISAGKPYPPLPHGTTATMLVPGLLASRLASGLTQPELAERAGIARETLARLERLRRRARSQTLNVLAQALGVSTQILTTGTDDLPMLQQHEQRNRPW